MFILSLEFISVHTEILLVIFITISLGGGHTTGFTNVYQHGLTEITLAPFTNMV